MTLGDILDVLQNGDSAAKIAERLQEPPGQKCRHSPARVVPLLNQAVDSGIVRRRVEGDPDREPVARWSFA